MAREIKFEYGFESVNGIVKKVYELYEIPNIKEKCDVWGVLPIKYVRQFTGVININGAEVYEGDIVQLKGGRKPKNGERPYYNTVVVFNDGLFTIKDNLSIYTDSAILRLCTVIGNIYENPELINLKKD